VNSSLWTILVFSEETVEFELRYVIGVEVTVERMRMSHFINYWRCLCWFVSERVNEDEMLTELCLCRFVPLFAECGTTVLKG
jgi:hypothetical protein